MDILFYCNAMAITLEYSLHRFRQYPTTESKANVQNALKHFQNQLYGKSLLQARRYHLQAYFAYLRKMNSRAKLLLEDCLIASKTNEMTFDYEWALTSKKTWFANSDVDIEQQAGGTIKYIFPRTV